ncbi:MAG: hypothetical protein WCT03_03915 [Candidatus Obscuribacterales bacterium]
MLNTKKIRVNPNPRCSVTKLGEYCSQQSSPARRQAIVKSQKFPPAFKVITYNPASQFLSELLVDGFNEESLVEKINEFNAQKNEAVAPYDKLQAGCCMDSLIAFPQVVAKLPLVNCSLRRGPKSWALDIQGVTVSIRPELFISLEDRNGVPKIGCIKLYFSKTHPLDSHAAGVISAVIVEKIKQSIPSAKISNSHIFVVDVFAGNVFTAPASHKRLFKEAEAACQELAYSWPRYSAS